MENIRFLSVMTAPASSGSSTFNITSYNATPNVSLTVTVTGINVGMSEEQVAMTMCQQISSAFFTNGVLFQGVLGTLVSPTSAAFQTAVTDHVISVFSQSQYSFTQVADTTGCNYFLDTTPIFCTVDEAMAFGPLANQMLQGCNGPLTTQQIIDLLAMASSDAVGILRNNIVSCFYVFYFTTMLTNAIKFPNTPIQFYWNPYTLRPTIIAMATQVATFDLASRYEVDFRSGWCTFRFAQDILFNYEPFDYNNQWYIAYQAGYNQIPREIKTAILRWSYVIQSVGFLNVSSISDGNTEIKYSVDKNIEKRNIFSTLRQYMQ